MWRYDRLIAMLSLTLVLLACPLAVAADKDGFEDRFDIKPSDFASTGRNDYFILEPGYQLVLEGRDEGKPVRLVITVLDETRTVDGVETRVVEERESAADELVEVSRNFFAVDRRTNDVYYFGEDVDMYTNGRVTGHGGSWLSGKDGARYGLFMPAHPRVGQRAYQEVAPKVAMDRFEVVSITERVDVPAGRFERCLDTLETTPLEPDKAHKLYAPGVGLLIDGPLKLVKYGQKTPDAGGQPPKQEGNATTQRAANEGGADAGARAAAGTEAAAPVVPIEVAREALNSVGADPEAEWVWLAAINDPSLTAHQRQDLIEDLNENGFVDPHHVTRDELPLVLSRLQLIETMAPDAMDQVNADAFAEAYKDLINIADRLTRE